MRVQVPPRPPFVQDKGEYTLALKTKCIKAPFDKSDGLRISVMSRHTLQDGKTPDPEITERKFDEWWTTLAPPPLLVGGYYRGRFTWEQFAKRYRNYLDEMELTHARLIYLISLAQRMDVTIMCVEPTPEKCHRRLIAEACKQLCPQLDIVIE